MIKQLMISKEDIFLHRRFTEPEAIFWSPHGS